MKRLLMLFMVGFVVLLSAPTALYAAGVSYAPSSFSEQILSKETKDLVVTIFNPDISKQAVYELSVEGDLKKGQDIFFPNLVSIPVGVSSKTLTLHLETKNLTPDKTYKSEFRFVSTERGVSATEGFTYRLGGMIPLAIEVVSTATEDMLAQPYNQSKIGDFRLSNPYAIDGKDFAFDVTNTSKNYYGRFRIDGSFYLLGQTKSSDFVVFGEEVIGPNETKTIRTHDFSGGPGVYVMKWQAADGEKTHVVVLQPLLGWLRYFAFQWYTVVFIVLTVGLLHWLLARKKTSKRMWYVWIGVYTCASAFAFFLQTQSYVFLKNETQNTSVQKPYDYLVAVNDGEHKTTIYNRSEANQFVLQGSWKLMAIAQNFSQSALVALPVSEDARKDSQDNFYVIMNEKIIPHSTSILPATVTDVQVGGGDQLLLIQGMQENDSAPTYCVVQLLDSSSPCLEIRALTQAQVTNVSFANENDNFLMWTDASGPKVYSVWEKRFVPETKTTAKMHVVTWEEPKELKQFPSLFYTRAIYNNKRWFFLNPLDEYKSLDSETLLSMHGNGRALISKQTGVWHALPMFPRTAHIYFLNQGKAMTTP